MDVTYTQYGKQGQILSVLNTDSLIDGNHLFYFIQYPEDKSVWNGGGFGNLINGDSMLCAARMSDTDTFDLSLENLINGNSMFKSCSGLTSFDSKLTSLKSGYEMFGDCSLNESSLICIADNINDIRDLDRENKEDWIYEVLGETKTISSAYRGRIDISHDESVTQEVIVECGNKLMDKGWDVYFNGTLYEYTNVGLSYDVSEANGYIPDAYKNGSDSWNTVVLIPYIDVLKISKVNENGEMSNNQGKVGIIEYDKLAVGDSLMKNNTYLWKWACPLPNLTNGGYMFCGCDALTSFSSNLSSLTNGGYMFCGCGLPSFTTDLPSLTNGGYMFYECSNLTSFNADLHSLVDCSFMFYKCTGLKIFSSDLSRLTDCFNMFSYCENLTSFTTDLPSLVSGNNMFWDCKNLTTFSSKLGSLKSANAMFSGCKLNETSLRNIADNINDLKAKGYDKNNDEHWKYEVLGETITINKYWRGHIDIDLDESVTQNVKNECGNKLIAKGWEVYFNDKFYQK